ncbi:hypothetical protein FB45DRAFT_37582 [Roridomyces roridus]|uniref:Uncharacterized protein n=1 Tax=Roridomyces roridus TaxID=1738132 RepID=A0AAD7BQW3_9AGAR|nr:hypothetical protein FB45DRAFT_37582 [Roridomyces roridus]
MFLLLVARLRSTLGALGFQRWFNHVRHAIEAAIHTRPDARCPPSQCPNLLTLLQARVDFNIRQARLAAEYKPPSFPPLLRFQALEDDAEDAQRNAMKYAKSTLSHSFHVHIRREKNLPKLAHTMISSTLFSVDTICGILGKLFSRQYVSPVVGHQNFLFFVTALHDCRGAAIFKTWFLGTFGPLIKAVVDGVRELFGQAKQFQPQQPPQPNPFARSYPLFLCLVQDQAREEERIKAAERPSHFYRFAQAAKSSHGLVHDRYRGLL